MRLFAAFLPFLLLYLTPGAASAVPDRVVDATVETQPVEHSKFSGFGINL